MPLTSEQFRLVLQQLDKAEHPERLYPLLEVDKIPNPIQSKSPKLSSQEKKYLSPEKIRESWDIYISNPTISSKEIADRYGFSSMAPLRNRWEALKIYDPVLDYKRSRQSGLIGYPLDMLKSRIPEERLDEIEIDYEERTMTYSELMSDDESNV